MTSGSTLTHLIVIAASVSSDAAVEPAQQGVALVAVAGKPAVVAEHCDGGGGRAGGGGGSRGGGGGGGNTVAFAGGGGAARRPAARAIDRPDPLGVLGEP